MSIPSKSKVKLAGIFSLGHFNSTLRLTMFKTSAAKATAVFTPAGYLVRLAWQTRAGRDPRKPGRR